MLIRNTKVWRNVRGQYQFKTAEVTSDLSATMFFGRIDLSLSTRSKSQPGELWCYSDVAIVHHSRFCKANRNMVPGSPAWTKIRDVKSHTTSQTDLTPLKTIEARYHCVHPMVAVQIYPTKNMAASKSDVTSAILNWYWPRTFLHTFAMKLSIGSEIFYGLSLSQSFYICGLIWGFWFCKKTP